MTYWSKEKVDKLRELASETKYTAREIGVILDVSRQSVIGKCHREGIKLLSHDESIRRAFGVTPGDAYTLNLLGEIAGRYGLSVAAITAGGQLPRRAMRARAWASYRFRIELRLSFPSIAKMLHTDHKTVMRDVKIVHRHLRVGKSWLDEPEPVKKLKTIAEEMPVIAAHPAVDQARSINAYWQRRGINANARAVRVHGRVVVKSDLELVRATA